MKTNWLAKNQQKRCILFFNGWGMDQNAVSNLGCGDFDVCMFYDFENFQHDESEFKQYSELYLVSWSLGVYASALTLMNSKMQFVKKIAINGTLNPVCDNCGIAEQIFEGTLDNWNLANREKFDRRMFGSLFSNSQPYLSARNAENQKHELSHIYEMYITHGELTFSFDIAVVGEKDLIFLKQNQLNYWQHKTNTQLMDIPHFPFGNFQSWQQIIDLAINV